MPYFFLKLIDIKFVWFLKFCLKKVHETAFFIKYPSNNIGKKDMKTTKTQGKLNQGKLKQNCCCEPCIKRYWKIKKIIDTLELHSF